SRQARPLAHAVVRSIAPLSPFLTPYRLRTAFGPVVRRRQAALLPTRAGRILRRILRGRRCVIALEGRSAMDRKSEGDFRQQRRLRRSQMQLLDRQRVLITGGSRGLGLGVAEALVARGADVTVVARDPARLIELKDRVGVSIIPGDATDPKLAE